MSFSQYLYGLGASRSSSTGICCRIGCFIMEIQTGITMATLRMNGTFRSLRILGLRIGNYVSFFTLTPEATQCALGLGFDLRAKMRCGSSGLRAPRGEDLIDRSQLSATISSGRQAPGDKLRLSATTSLQDLPAFVAFHLSWLRCGC